MAAPPFQPPLIKFPPMTSGPTVRQWQQKMRERGWNLEADGQYGPVSKRSCMNFQREHNLEVDGIVGPRTWKATWEAPSTMPPPWPGTVLEVGSTGGPVETWEAQLDSRGWRVSAVDQTYDVKTEQACKAMQGFKGLPATGKVDQQTWNAVWQENVPAGV
jgi:peptidoglycan hydrolase-like protein with peptidoglycan-binding domain